MVDYSRTRVYHHGSRSFLPILPRPLGGAFLLAAQRSKHAAQHIRSTNGQHEITSGNPRRVDQRRLQAKPRQAQKCECPRHQQPKDRVGLCLNETHFSALHTRPDFQAAGRVAQCARASGDTACCLATLPPPSSNALLLAPCDDLRTSSSEARQAGRPAKRQ